MGCGTHVCVIVSVTIRWYEYWNEGFFYLLKRKKNEFKFENADYIMKNGMLVGCHPKLEQVDLDYICNSLIEFFDGR